MSQTITNYTTYDLAYYYADLARLPRLSQEERQQLIAATTQTTRLDTQVRNRLIEGHLKLATHVAIDRCPPSYYRSFPDILGGVALALVKVTDRYDFQAGKDFTSYVVACTDFAVKQAIGNDRLIKVPGSSIARARQQGVEKQLYDLQPESLDTWMEWFHTDEGEEPPTPSLLPTHEAPPRDPVLRAQVQAWLSYLSPRSQHVLTLRYGLSDEDERNLTTAEIAHAMGLKRQIVQHSEKDALKRIKALVEGTATIVEKNGKPHVTGVYKFKPPTLTLEHEAIFTQATKSLCAQGNKVSSRILAQATGKSVHLASAFLRLHHDELPLSARARPTHQERQTSLGQIYAELEAQGAPITAARLAKVAHVRHETASAFMHTRKEEHNAAVQAR